MSDDDIEIVWEKRSLQEFADRPIQDLAKSYDLLVIDHPWTGSAASLGLLYPLDEILGRDFLEDLFLNSVGESHVSYNYEGKQWALATDAAAPVAAYRPDLLDRHNVGVPQTWEEIISLGRKRRVACPGIPLDVYGNFLNLCKSAGAEIFVSAEEVVNWGDGLEALERLRELASVVPDYFFFRNPIQTLELMATSDAFAYCPYTYGYSNYARRYYSKNRLKFCDVVEIVPGRPGRTMLGGAGLAISAYCQYPEVAGRFVEYVASWRTQCGIYFEAGGQPGHRKAWKDPVLNEQTGGFFKDTLTTLDRAFLRPRYPGYLKFQDVAGAPIQDFLRNDLPAGDTLEVLNHLYREHCKTLECLKT